LFIFFSMFSLVFWLKSVVLWVGHAFFAALSVVPSFLMIKVKVKNLNKAPTL
jgi:asparagine N-glycosylation enzyme membrane subunit Stt3